MTNKIICNAEDLTAIADAVRASNGSTNTYNVPELSAAAVNAIGTGGAGIGIDDTLTISGAAADAKVTGERFTALSEEIEEIETLTATTDMRGDFADLPDGDKTIAIYSDGIFGNNAYISTSDDFMLRGGFNRTMPFRGVTVAPKGRGWTINGTVTEPSTSIYFADHKGNTYAEIPSELVGKALTALTFSNDQSNSGGIVFAFYDANKSFLSQASMYIKTQERSVTIPEGAVYFQTSLSLYNGKTYNEEIQIYLLYPDKISQIALTGEITLIDTTETQFSVVPYKGTASFKLPLKEYIDNYAGGGTVTYVTPEEYGALGDGSTDDSAAISACIQAASESGQSVMMAKTYYVTQPIVIDKNGLDVCINDVVYSGSGCALKIVGMKNTIKIHSITSNGVGIGIYADNSISTSYNIIDVNTVVSQSHGIVFYYGSSYAHQNTIRFALIKAGGAGCYGIAVDDNEYGDSFISENNFYGGQISNCEWAVYKVGGNSRCYGFEIEEGVQGGFYINESGGLAIFYPRHAESSRDGAHAFLKYIGTENTIVHLSSPLAINEIDLTDAIDTFVAGGNDYPLHEGRFGVIYGQIGDLIPAVGVNRDSAQVYANETYIWGKNMIFRPHMDYRCEVTADVLDTRLIGTSTEHSAPFLTQLPTLFAVNACNTTINLHASYCAFGITEFVVQQSGGFCATVTDYIGTVVFDGTQYGNGTYKIKAWKDKNECKASANLLRCDLGGQVWSVEPVLTMESYRALMGLTTATN